MIHSFISLAFFGSLIVSAFNDKGACPNDCTGHGRCSVENACICDAKWKTAPDCSQTTCPSGTAWAGKPHKANSAHRSIECSDRGICDRSSGLCQCYDGYDGVACDRYSCPNNCGDHGTCMTIGNVYKLYGTELSLSPIYLSNDTRLYSKWDADKLTQCVCDYGYTGHACELRMCPKGDDPLTSFGNYRSVIISLRASSGKIGGTVQLVINGNTIKFPAAYTAWSTTQCETDFAKMPNLEEVRCSRTQSPDSIGNVDWTVAFKRFPMNPYENNVYSNDGSLPLEQFDCRNNFMTGTGVTCAVTDVATSSIPGSSLTSATLFASPSLPLLAA